MAELDLYHKSKTKAFTTHFFSSNETFNMANNNAVDGANGVAESIVFVGRAHSIVDGDYAFQMQESDDNSNWNDVPDDVWFPGPFSIDSTQFLRMGYVGKKKHCRMQVTSTNVSSGGQVTLTVIHADFDSNPIPDQPAA